MKTIEQFLMRKIFCKLGFHNYSLVLSRYSSFNWRDTTWQCSCCKKLKESHLPHNWIYPFKTEFEDDWKEKHKALKQEYEIKK